VSGRFKRRCGAWAKGKGRPCQAKGLANGRCRLHGGIVGAGAGIRTPEGLRRTGDAQLARWARWRAQRGLPPTWRGRDVRMRAENWLAKRAELAGEKAEEPAKV
jgi:hypothetical protein